MGVSRGLLIEMEKRKSCAVILTHRNSEPVGKELKKLDWDGLVDEVFKEEVDQFCIESGVQALHIQQNTNSWAVIPKSTSSSASRLFPTNAKLLESSTSRSTSANKDDKKCGRQFQDTTAHWQDKKQKKRQETYWTSFI